MLRYFIFYKPYGVLSQFTREVSNHKVIGDYFSFPDDVYPVGRLDKDSEGLLFLTNDKKCVDHMLNPSSKKEKVYHVQVDGAITKEAIRKLRSGVEIKLPNKKMYITRPAKVTILSAVDYEERDPPIRFRKDIPTSWVEIKLTEGKNRQIRKMCAKVGFPVLRLIRIRIGNLDLNGMKSADVQEVENPMKA